MILINQQNSMLMTRHRHKLAVLSSSAMYNTLEVIKIVNQQAKSFGLNLKFNNSIQRMKKYDIKRIL